MHKLILIAALLASSAAQANEYTPLPPPDFNAMRQREMERQVDENNAILRRQEMRRMDREMNCRTGYEQSCR